MPSRCCIPMCTSNYCSSVKREGVRSTFSLPKDDELKQMWLKAIPRKNWIPSKYSSVCELHFNPSEIKRFDRHLLPDGTTNLIPCKPTLKWNTVPSIFPGYLFKRVVKKDPETKQGNHEYKFLIENCEKFELIEDYENFILSFAEKLSISDEWNIKILTSKIVFYTLNLNADALIIENQILISNNMTVKIFVRGRQLQIDELKWILNFEMKIDSWLRMQNLLDNFKFTYYCGNLMKHSLPYVLQESESNLEILIKEENRLETSRAWSIKQEISKV